MLAEQVTAKIKAMSTKQMKLSQQLRDAILNAPMSRYQLSKLSRVSEGSLSRFVNHKSSLTLASIDEIGDVLGVQIVVHQTKRKGK